MNWYKLEHDLKIWHAASFLNEEGFFLHHVDWNFPDFNYNEDTVISACQSALKQLGSDFVILSTYNCPFCGEMFAGYNSELCGCTCMTQDQVTKFIQRHRKEV